MSSAANSHADARLAKPRVLIAGTQHAIAVLEKVLGADFKVTSATSIAEALACAGQADLVMCNLQFDDSRMFEFLHALREDHALKNMPVICCRVHRDPLSPNVRRAIEHALQALGIALFVDRPLLLERYPQGIVDEMLLQLVIDCLPRSVGPGP